jgi:hypothetical protein
MAARTREVIARSTDIRCHAPHPNAATDPSFIGIVHDSFITQLPFAAVFTGRVVSRYDEVRDGYYGGKCRCGKISEYEILSPEQLRESA